MDSDDAKPTRRAAPKEYLELQFDTERQLRKTKLQAQMEARRAAFKTEDSSPLSKARASAVERIMKTPQKTPKSADTPWSIDAHSDDTDTSSDAPPPRRTHASSRRQPPTPSTAPPESPIPRQPVTTSAPPPTTTPDSVYVTPHGDKPASITLASRQKPDSRATSAQPSTTREELLRQQVEDDLEAERARSTAQRAEEQRQAEALLIARKAAAIAEDHLKTIAEQQARDSHRRRQMETELLAEIQARTTAQAKLDEVTRTNQKLENDVAELKRMFAAMQSSRTPTTQTPVMSPTVTVTLKTPVVTLKTPVVTLKTPTVTMPEPPASAPPTIVPRAFRAVSTQEQQPPSPLIIRPGEREGDAWVRARRQQAIKRETGATSGMQHGPTTDTARSTVTPTHTIEDLRAPTNAAAPPPAPTLQAPERFTEALQFSRAPTAPSALRTTDLFNEKAELLLFVNAYDDYRQLCKANPARKFTPMRLYECLESELRRTIHEWTKPAVILPTNVSERNPSYDASDPLSFEYLWDAKLYEAFRASIDRPTARESDRFEHLKPALRANVTVAAKGEWTTIVRGLRLAHTQYLLKFRLGKFYNSKSGRRHLVTEYTDMLPSPMDDCARGITEKKEYNDIAEYFDDIGKLTDLWEGVQASARPRQLANLGRGRASFRTRATSYESHSRSRSHHTSDYRRDKDHRRDNDRRRSDHRDDRDRTRSYDSRDTSETRASSRADSQPSHRSTTPEPSKPRPSTPRPAPSSARINAVSPATPATPATPTRPPSTGKPRDSDDRRPRRDSSDRDKKKRHDDKPPRCKICRKTSHKTEDCRNRDHRKTTKPEAHRAVHNIQSKSSMHDIQDGTLKMGALEIPFTADTGATHSVISVERARILEDDPKYTLTKLRRPMFMDTASAGVKQRVCATHILRGPALLTSKDNDNLVVSDIRFFVASNLTSQLAIIGRGGTNTIFGIDVQAAFKAATKLATTAEAAATINFLKSQSQPPDAIAAESTSIDEAITAAESASTDKATTTAEVHVALPKDPPSATELADEKLLDEKQPQVTADKPPEFNEPLYLKLQAFELWAPEGDRSLVSAFTATVMREYSHFFQDGITINMTAANIPGMEEGIRVDVNEAEFNKIRTARRTYPQPVSNMVDAYMTLLERAGFIRRTNYLHAASPVHPVRKSDALPGDPIDKQYRITVDMRAVNRVTVKALANLPKLSILRSHLANVKFQGKLDLSNGYWQFKLHPDCQKYFGLSTDRGFWISLRLLQGSLNAAGPFHHAIVAALGDLLKGKVVVFVDDIWIGGDTMEEFLGNWLEVIKRLNAAGLHGSVKKTTFGADELLWCGYWITKDGIKPNPTLVKTLMEMPTPTDAAQLRQYIGTVNWMSEAIPRFTEIIQPLQELLTAALRLCNKNKKNKAAAAIALETAGWTTVHDEAFRRMQEAVAEATTLAHPRIDDKWEMCVFCDASQSHASTVITQRRKSDATRPIADQRHQPLLFKGHRFVNNERSWSIKDKEAFALKEACVAVEHLMHPSYPIRVFTDHRNLEFMFQQPHLSAAANRVASDRIQRWIAIMSTYNYTLSAIPGEENLAADMLSRWGAKGYAEEVAKDAAEAAEAATQRTADATPAIHVTTRSRARQVEFTDDTDSATTSDSDTDTSSAHDSHHEEDEDSATATAAPRRDTVPMNAISFTDMPTEAELILAHEAMTADDIAAAHGTRDSAGFVRNAHGRLFVPDVNALRQRILITAHQGPMAHWGSDETANHVQELFYWPGQRSDIKQFCRECDACLRVKGGRTIPRPMLTTERATRPNQLVHFDYVHIRDPHRSNTDFKYLLVVQDNFSRYVHLYAAKTCDAETAVTSLLDWFSRYGIPSGFTSDKGTHFIAEIVRELADRYDIHHHFTAVQAAWSNGRIERVNRRIREALSAYMADRLARDDDWILYINVITFALNNARSTAIAKYTPFEAFIGRKPQHALTTVFRPATGTFREADNATIRKAITALREEFDNITSEINDYQPRRRRQQPTHPVNFDVNDYVLLSSAIGVKDRHKDKTQPIWTGLARVLEVVGPHVFRVRDIINDRELDVHAAHLKRYAGRDLVITDAIRSRAAHGGRGFAIDTVLAHRINSDNTIDLNIRWEDNDTTWEPVARIQRDAPLVVARYRATLSEQDQQLF